MCAHSRLCDAKNLRNENIDNLMRQLRARVFIAMHPIIHNSNGKCCLNITCVNYIIFKINLKIKILVE